MDIALYPHHNVLPFSGGKPEQPKLLFNPEIMGEWKIPVDSKPVALQDSCMWPILMGLRAIYLPVLAHVSLHANPRARMFEWPKRVWIQISTRPHQCCADDVPIVVTENQVLVERLWNYAETHMPYELLGKNPVAGEETPEFWAQFFLTKLQEAKCGAESNATEAVASAAAVARAYAAIPAAA